MLLISLLLLSSLSYAQRLPQLLTKHAPETLRYISSDGNTAYVKKNNGVLGLVMGYRSSDFMSDKTYSDFLITDSFEKIRLAIEVIPEHHRTLDMNKLHHIYVTRKGQDKPIEIGQGRYPQLHLGDEWISFYRPNDQQIVLRNILTTKEYKISLSKKSNPFFFPYYAMTSSEYFVYTDINDRGLAQVNLLDLTTNKAQVLLRAGQPGTFFEVCQEKDYFAVGEFPYEGIQKGSRILTYTRKGPKPSGYTTLYSTNDSDLGNMVCLKNSIYFVKTTSFDSTLVAKKTEAAKINLTDSKLEIKSNLENVTQIILMDGRVLLPFRENLFVLEGTSNIEVDTLQRIPNEGE